MTIDWARSVLLRPAVPALVQQTHPKQACFYQPSFLDFLASQPENSTP